MPSEPKGPQLLLEELLRERDEMNRRIDELQRTLELGQGPRAEPQTGPPSAPVAPLAPLTPPERPGAVVDAATLRGMSEEELDQLPYGVVTLDAQARVVGYSDTESRLMKVPRARVLGRNWFDEVAPCTKVREFESRFRDVVAGHSRLGKETFDFVFRFPTGEQRVTISILPARRRGEFHVCIVRRQ
ncbi:MAG: PAS domain-containing protein [Myxococcota bacterium]